MYIHVPISIEVHLKHLVQLFMHLKINSVKLHLELRKLLHVGMLVPKMFSTYIGLMPMTLDPAATVTLAV